MPKTPDPNEIILARRREGYGAVSVEFGALQERMPDWTPSEATQRDGLIHEGDTIPMRREEAEGREDFEPADVAPEKEG